MSRLDRFSISAFFFLLTMSAPAAVWAQGDPGEVPDLAVHQGPNTVEPGDLSGNFIVFGDGRAQGTVMLRGPNGLFIWDVYAADIICGGLGAPQLAEIILYTDLRHIDKGPPTSTDDIVVVVSTTDIPACLIWDIADGNVHDEPVHTDGARIQIFNDPCAAQ
jgi:hypothetical protein